MQKYRKTFILLSEGFLYVACKDLGIVLSKVNSLYKKPANTKNTINVKMIYNWG